MNKLFMVGAAAFALAIPSVASAEYGEQPGFAVSQ
jgi:hypothetical protein